MAIDPKYIDWLIEFGLDPAMVQEPVLSWARDEHGTLKVDKGNEPLKTTPLRTIARHNEQTPIYDPATGAQTSESSHIWADSHIVEQTTDPLTGKSPFDGRAYGQSPTLKTTRETEVAKNRGPDGDDAALNALRSAKEAGTVSPAELAKTSLEAGIQRQVRAAAETGDTSVTEAKAALAGHGEAGQLFKSARPQVRELLRSNSKSGPGPFSEADINSLTENMEGNVQVATDSFAQVRFNGTQMAALPPEAPLVSAEPTGTRVEQSTDMPRDQESVENSPVSERDIQKNPGGGPDEAPTPRELPEATPREYSPVSERDIQTNPGGGPGEAPTPRELPEATPREYSPVSESEILTNPGGGPSQAATPRMPAEGEGAPPTLRSPVGPEAVSGAEPDVRVSQAGSAEEALGQPYKALEPLPNPVGSDGTPVTLRSSGADAASGAVDAEAGTAGAEATTGIGGAAAEAGVLGGAIAGGMAAVDDYGKVKSGQMTASEAAVDVGGKTVVAGGITAVGVATAKVLAGGVAESGGIVGGVVGAGMAAVDDYGKVKSGTMTEGQATVDIGAKTAVGVGAGLAGAAAAGLASAAVGAEVGAAAGSVVPVVGNLVGLAVGAVVGGAVGYLGNALMNTDTGKSVMTAASGVVDSAINAVEEAGTGAATMAVFGNGSNALPYDPNLDPTAQAQAPAEENSGGASAQGEISGAAAGASADTGASGTDDGGAGGISDGTGAAGGGADGPGDGMASGTAAGGGVGASGGAASVTTPAGDATSAGSSGENPGGGADGTPAANGSTDG